MSDNNENNPVATNPPDFSKLNAGQHDPYLNKKIEELIIHDEKYIVYLDEDLNVQWNIYNDQDTPNLGKILNKVSALACTSDFMNAGKTIRYIANFFGKKRSAAIINYFRDSSLRKIRILLGEAVARIFDGNDEAQAKSAIYEANRLISAKNSEYARRWYYNHAAIFVASTLGIALALWLNRTSLISEILGKTAFDVIFCSLFGALGAFVFVARRGQKIELNAISGPVVHKLEADARLATGMATAAVINLAIKSGFLSGAIHNASQLSFMLMASILSGYSERFVPNMAAKFSTAMSHNFDEKKTFETSTTTEESASKAASRLAESETTPSAKEEETPSPQNANNQPPAG